MKERPTAVTVIGWFWKAGGILGMVFALPLAFWGQDLYAKYWPDALLNLSPTILFLWMFLSSLICLLCGNGLLSGRNWARILVMAYCVGATLTAAVISRAHHLYWFNLISNLVFTVIMWFFLYRPHIAAYFKGDSLLDDLEGG